MNRETGVKVVEVPILVAERIISVLEPRVCPWCSPDFEAAGEHEEVHIHRTLCPIGELSRIYNEQRI